MWPTSCNFYGPSQLATAFAAITPAASYTDRSRRPRSELLPDDAQRQHRRGPPDYVGVYVKITHPWITGLFGSNLTMTSNNVTQLEPQKLTS